MSFSLKRLLPIVILFIMVNALVLVFGKKLETYNIDSSVILGANILFLLISIFSFFIQTRGMKHSNPHVFVRSVMTGMMLKMLLCVAAVFIYVYTSGEGFNKKGVFISLFLYLFYLAAEVKILMNMNSKKNA